MTTANHVLIGATIGSAIKQPELALPLAFLSHFVLDTIPHFGYARAGYGTAFKHKTTFFELPLDLAGILIVLFTFHFSVLLVVLCAVLAVLPDFEWPYRYFLFERIGKKPPSTPLTNFHRKIQWCEKPWGLYIEIVFYVCALYLVHHFILH